MSNENKRWERLTECLEDYVNINGRLYSHQDIINEDPDYIDLFFIKPVRSEMIENEMRIRIYSNGDVERQYKYNVFPPSLIDGTPLLNVYGQQIYNDLTHRLSQRMENLNEKN